MPLPETHNPGPEVVEELRNLFRKKMEQDPAKIPAGGFHEHDLNKIFINDVWLTKFLENNDLDMKESLKQLWDTCMWRKTANINELSEDNVRMEYVREGIMFPRGRDIDGKVLFIYRSRLYTRGSRNLDDMKRMFLYWLERLIRESDDDYLTIMFELTDAGLSNVDMELTKYIITALKSYYPYSLNYILVYDLPWILNATFQIIKRLLPSKAVDRLKNINSKTIREFIDEDNMLTQWGGKDDYVFKYIPERKRIEELLNNNIIIQNNNNLKKVHFANLNPQESPMNESANSNFEFESKSDEEMLRITQPNTIAFTKAATELVGNVEFTNIDTKPVTYKIKTTAPDKFRVRPSNGVLSPGASVTVNVVVHQGQQVSSLNREKFLIMCMSLGNDASTNAHDLAELWKSTSVSSSMVELHRLKCVLPINMDDGGMNVKIQKYDDISSIGTGYSPVGSDKQMSHFQHIVSQLCESNRRLEGQMKFNRTLQIVTIVLFILLSVVTIYGLKKEIRNSTLQYCSNH